MHDGCRKHIEMKPSNLTMKRTSKKRKNISENEMLSTVVFFKPQLLNFEMPSSGDLKSGDPVSNYTTHTPFPPKKKAMRPPPHQINLHAAKST